MDIKLVILLCVTSAVFASDIYNYGALGYNPYYLVGGYPIGTHEEFEYYDQSYGHAPVAASYSVAQQNQVPVSYNARVVSPALYPAGPVANYVHVNNVPQVARTVVSTTPAPVVTTVAPILAKSYQLGLVYPYTGLVPAVASHGTNNIAVASSVSNVNAQSVVTPTSATPIVYSTTEKPIVASNVGVAGRAGSAFNLPIYLGTRSNVVSYPYPSLHLNNIASLGGYNYAASNYNSVPGLVKSNVPSNVADSPLSQNVYLSSIANHNTGNLYYSTLSKSNEPWQTLGNGFNPGFYTSTSNRVGQNAFGLSQSQILSAGNFGGLVPANVNPINTVVTTVSPTGPSNIISYSATTPNPLNSFLPVTSTYTSVNKQTVYRAPAPVPQPLPSLYFSGNVNPTYNSNTLQQNHIISVPASTISPLVSHNGSPSPIVYSTAPTPIVTTIHIPTASAQAYVSQVTTTPTPTIVTTQKPSITTIYTNNESSNKMATVQTNYVSNTGIQSTTTSKPIAVQDTASKISISTEKPTTQTTSSTTLVTNPTVLTTTQSTVVNYAPKQTFSTLGTAYATESTLPAPKPTVTSINQQDAITAALSGFSKSTTYKPPVTNNYVSSSTIYNKSTQNKYSTPATHSSASYSTQYKPSITNKYVSSPSVYNKDIQNTYTTPATYSTASYSTQSSYSTPRPTVNYNNVNKQDAFTALSGFSKSTTYKPTVTNNYVSSSSVYNKGIQNTYTIPTSYSTQSSLSTATPTTSYSTVYNQNAFSTAVSGFSKTTTYKPHVTNNYVNSSSIYNKRIESTYRKPVTYSTAFSTIQSGYTTPKPTVTYNNVNRQDAFSGALSGYLKPTTYRPHVKNNYFSSSSVYNKGFQTTYTTPATYTPSINTQSGIYTEKPAGTYYNNFNKQNAFAAAVSGFSKRTTYKTPVNNNFSSSFINNKASQNINTTPATYSTIYSSPSAFASTTKSPVAQSLSRGDQSSVSTSSLFQTNSNSSSVAVSTNQKSVTQQQNTGLVTSTTSITPSIAKIETQKNDLTSSVFPIKSSSVLTSSSKTDSVAANVYKPPNTYSKPVFFNNLYPKNKATYNINSSSNSAINSVYRSNVNNQYDSGLTAINKSYNQNVPFVTIPASNSYTTISSVKRKEFIPVSNYQGTLNVVVQPPVISDTKTTIVPSSLDYSNTLVTQSSPPEAVSNFVHSQTYLPPGLPAVSDAGSNGVVNLISEPVVTSTLTPAIVVNTTPRALPLSYDIPSEQLKVVPYTNQVTLKPVVYSTTPVITKVDSSPTLTPPVSYTRTEPVSSEIVQVSTENPLQYSAAPEVTTINYV